MYDFDNIDRLSDEELVNLLNKPDSIDKKLTSRADSVRREYYGKDVYLRALIEISSFCKNDCYYCGIRCSNKKATRYRLSKSELLDACKEGYELGYRTFVLQGGEDTYFTDDRLCDVVSDIRSKYRDCAITLSLGERSRDSYQALYDAGANRYLLRHETADNHHYNKLHPDSMSLDNRKQCLYALKEIGYQVGSGFMVGSPYQTTDNLVKDIRFLQELEPDMIGIGPYISHHDTPFYNMSDGSVHLTLRLISVLRLLFPYALIPSTTALNTLDPNGRVNGLKCGANVVMPNLTPIKYRGQYAIYDNKAVSGNEAAEYKKSLIKQINSAGYEVVMARGDVVKNSESTVVTDKK